MKKPDSTNLPLSAKKKFLLVSKDNLLLLKSFAKHKQWSLFDVTESILSQGLKSARERYLKDVVESSLRPRNDGLRYAISQQEKAYLVVSPELHEEITEFARKKNIKLIRATRFIIGMGLWAETSNDPRNTSEYRVRMEIFRTKLEEWRKRHPGESLEEAFGPGFLTKKEAEKLYWP